MKINRHNYEEFLLDFIEGNLPANEAEAVQSFLDKNPDVKAETQDLLNFKLADNATKFQSKNLLKKDPEVDIEGISKFERLSVAFLENDISDKEHLLLNKIIEQSEGKQHEHEVIQKTKLQIDKRVVFPNKSKLKQFPVFSNRKIIYFTSSIAASVALIISVFLVNTENKADSGLALNYHIHKTPSIRQSIVNQNFTNDKQFVIKETFVENMIANTSVIVRNGNTIESIENKQTALIDNNSEEKTIPTEKLLALTNTSSMQNKMQTEVAVKDYVNNTLLELGIEKQSNEKALLAKAGKSVAQFFTKLFKKNIQVKKIEVEDGRKLYAVRAGSLEFYTNVKSRKNKDKKPPVAN